MRCDACPVRPGIACASAWHPPLCTLHASQPAWAPIIAAQSEARAGEQAPSLAVDFGGFAGAPTPPVVDPIAVAIDLCEFREGCTCLASYKCLQAGYPAMVSLADCRACLSGTP